MTRGPAATPELAARRAVAQAGAAAVPPPGVQVSDKALGGVPVMAVRPDSATGDDRSMLWFHGGGYRMGSARAFTAWNCALAVAGGCEVLSVDYRLAPERPYPEALIDAVLAYTALLDSGRRVLVGGESAGAGLAAALMLAAADRGLAAPVAAVLCSPWLDLSNSAASFTDNAGTDEIFSRQSADQAAAIYLGGHPATDPYVSPLWGEWTAAGPPILVQASRDESLRDDAVRFGDIASTARIQLFDGLPHVWHLGYPQAPGSVEAVEGIVRFLDEFAAPARLAESAGAPGIRGNR
ncbi:alpha/beta hydrolase fold domain-containing protein [Nocardia jinanensis]|uniref:Alpha/beta hydrolase n=1 Tax=Nocardia jinanensis TaxID=382504 RepID=A0A917VS58_9NOCA|nr:alpha/beta hydrolase fold domain-containing protein [Nocardia jinanensis]GGL13307.1 alpha/beta hydrolase [Nocardia jinanensis]